MSLPESFRMYKQCADQIENWKNINKNELANLYIKYENDERLRSAYFSALMCRYYSNVYKYAKQSKLSPLGLDLDDYSDWLAESLQVAFKYRRWVDPENKLYNDPNGPDKVINRCIFSTRQRYYHDFNMDNRKINYTYMYSLDYCKEDEDYAKDEDNYYIENLNTNEDSEVDIYNSNDVCTSLIKYLVCNNSVVEAVVIDCIANEDCFKKITTLIPYVNEKGKNKNYHQNTYEFNKQKLVKCLNNLENSYYVKFMRMYDVDVEIMKNVVSTIRNNKNKKLYSIVDKLLSSNRLKELVCF